MKNLLIVLSGPSGVGKGTIVKRLMSGGNYWLSVSCTTRPPRSGEKDGREYFFLTRQQFKDKISAGGFLEYSEHFQNFYGTPRDIVEKELKERDVLLEIDVDGALQVKKSHPEAVLIMILPPDKEELKKRLLGRGTEAEEEISRRLARMDYELEKRDCYDFCVINDDLAAAVSEIENIIRSKKTV